MPRSVIQIRIDEDLKRKVDEYCKAKDTNYSELIKKYLRRLPEVK